MGLTGFAAEQLKLPYLSAYLNSLGTNFRHGANFATGGSTIGRPNETIFEYGISPFFLDMQIVQFDQFKSRTSDLYNEGCRFLVYPQCLAQRYLDSTMLEAVQCVWVSRASCYNMH